MNNWGGKRNNSGRKEIKNKRKKYSIYLNEEEKQELERINKNLSAAVRELLKEQNS